MPIRSIVAAAGGALAGGAAPGQTAGQFVIPEVRADGGSRFAYWDLFQAASNGFNYNFNNPPALLGGQDDEGNATTLTSGVTLVQNGTGQAFVTGSGAIYSFSAATAFRVDYTAPHTGDVTNVIFQTQTGGVRFDLANIRLEYTSNGSGEPVTESLAPDFKALDDPQSGGFAERLVSAFQWNLTGRGVRDFHLVFASPGSSMPLWEAQLDVIEGAIFVPQLGYLLVARTLPEVRFGTAGKVEKDLAVGAETRFHMPGTTLDLTATATEGFVHAGWQFEGSISEGTTLSVTFAAADVGVSAILAPADYETWRNHWFLHSNSLLGQPADNLNDAVSGATADPEGDGATNFAEFAFGGDPYASDAGAMAVLAGSHDGALTLTYRQPATALVAATYQLEASDDLRTWLPVGALELSRALETSGYWRVTVREKAAVGTAKRFLRCVATAQP